MTDGVTHSMPQEGTELAPSRHVRHIRDLECVRKSVKRLERRRSALELNAKGHFVAKVINVVPLDRVLRRNKIAKRLTGHFEGALVEIPHNGEIVLKQCELVEDSVASR